MGYYESCELMNFQSASFFHKKFNQEQGHTYQLFKQFYSQEEDLLRFNALNQLTLWGPSGETTDYAAKMWSGASVERGSKKKYSNYFKKSS